VDGVVFVADSLAVRRKENILSLKNLADNLATYKKSLFDVPIVLQYNKRDLQEEGIPLLSLDVLEKDLNTRLKAPSFEASALKGPNVVQTMKKVIVMTIDSLRRDLM
jgi:GTPase involved in cell partitioning and DNA repair